VPGRYRNARPAWAWYERFETGGGLRTVCAERYLFRPADGGTIEMRVRYLRGVPLRSDWPSIMRSAADPGIGRDYHSEALLDVVRSAPAGIDRVEEFALRVTVADLRDLFDGRERVVSITAVPWFLRQERALPT
jgi:hypothetical protein